MQWSHLKWHYWLQGDPWSDWHTDCPQIPAEAAGDTLLVTGKERQWCGAALLIKQAGKEESLSAFNRGKGNLASLLKILLEANKNASSSNISFYRATALSQVILLWCQMITLGISSSQATEFGLFKMTRLSFNLKPAFPRQIGLLHLFKCREKMRLFQ